MLCAAPSLKELDFANESISVRFGLLMDGVTNLLILDIANLTIFDNPSFNRDSTFSINPGQTSNLTFMVSKLDSSSQEMYINIYVYVFCVG